MDGDPLAYPMSRAAATVLVLALLVTAPLTPGCYQAAVVAGPEAHVALWRTQAREQGERQAPLEALDAASAVALALARNPELRALRAAVRAAEVAASAPGRFSDIELRVTDVRVDEIRAKDGAVDLALRAQPDRPGLPDSRADLARLDHASSRAGLAEAERDLAARVRQLHARVLLAREGRRVAEEDAELRKRGRALIARKVELAVATELDLALADLERAEVDDEAREAEVDASAAEARLREALDLSPTATLTLAGPPGGIADDVGPPGERGALIEQALRSRPELEVAAVGVASAGVAVWRARTARWPWFRFVQVGYRAGPKFGADSWGFAVGVDVPLFAWIGDDVSVAEAEVDRRRAVHAAGVATVARQVDSALERVAATRARLNAIVAELLPAAASATAAAERAADQGALDPLRVLRLEAARLRAGRRHLRARSDWIRARLRLEAVVAAAAPSE